MSTNVRGCYVESRDDSNMCFVHSNMFALFERLNNRSNIDVDVSIDSFETSTRRDVDASNETKRRKRCANNAIVRVASTDDELSEWISATKSCDVRVSAKEFFDRSRRTFDVGRERSIRRTYDALWSLVYSNESVIDASLSQFAIVDNGQLFSPTCVEPRSNSLSNNRSGRKRRSCVSTANGTHIWRNLPSFPMIGNSKIDELLSASLGTEFSKRTNRVKSALANPTYPLLTRSVAYESSWTVDVELTYRKRIDEISNAERNCTVSLPATFSLGRNVTKLMDYAYTSARAAWVVLARLITWTEDFYCEFNCYPVRTSVWDALVVECEAISIARNDFDVWSEGVRLATATVDVGDVVAYVHTLRVLTLMVYLSCCYTEAIDRKLRASLRVSYRKHDCVLPQKTADIYFSLFHASTFPHKFLSRMRNEN